MSKVRTAAVTIALGVIAFNHAAEAQTTYTVAPGQCGVTVSQLQCTIALPPANSLGIYPTLQLTDDLGTDTGGLVDWSTMKGLNGQYLGDGVIQKDSGGRYRSYPVWSRECSNGSCTEQVTAVTVYFEGTYIGGGVYSGLYTLHMSYSYTYSFRGGWRWIRKVTGGAVTLTQ